jgi:hypothetical protein
MNKSRNPETQRHKETHLSDPGTLMKERLMPQLCKTIAPHRITIEYLLM